MSQTRFSENEMPYLAKVLFALVNSFDPNAPEDERAKKTELILKTVDNFLEFTQLKKRENELNLEFAQLKKRENELNEAVSIYLKDQKPDTKIEAPKQKNIDINISDDINGYSLLFLALSRSNFALAKYLLEKKADPNFRTLIGYTPLMLASQKTNVEMINLLIENKADVDTLDFKGGNLCHNALQHALFAFEYTNKSDGSKPTNEDISKTVEALINAKADVNISSSGGATPLALICAFKEAWNETVFDLLLEAKASTLVKNQIYKGYLPFVMAARAGNMAAVQRLLDKDSINESLYKTGEKPVTAFLNALAHGHFNIVAFLLKNGAEITNAKLFLNKILADPDQRKPEILECLTILVERANDFEILSTEDFKKAEDYLEKLNLLNNHFKKETIAHVKDSDMKEIPSGVLNIVGLFGNNLSDQIKQPFKSTEIDNVLKQNHIASIKTISKK